MKKVHLTRNQILKLATFLALDEGIASVEITEHHQSGIGLGHQVQFYKDKIEKSFEQDITDVSNW